MASRNDHIRAEELFSAYIDKHVTADERTFVERHVASCADCRAKLQTTRTMIAALKAMPPVRAPRSFVLPKELAKQPKRSVFAWYPALRLATVMAVLAFAIVFASDLLTIRGGGVASVPMAASVPTALPAPTTAPAAQPTAAAQTLAQTAPADQVPAPIAPAAGAARLPVTETPEAANDNAALMAKSAPSETVTMTVASGNAQAAETAEATPAPEAAMPDRAGPEPVTAVAAESAPAFDPLRVATIALGGLVVVLIAATLVVRRNV